MATLNLCPHYVLDLYTFGKYCMLEKASGTFTKHFHRVLFTQWVLEGYLFVLHWENILFVSIACFQLYGKV